MITMFLLLAASATAASSASFTAPLRVAVLQITRGSGSGLSQATQFLRDAKSTSSAQIAVLPGRFLDMSAQGVAVDALAPIARELAMGVLSTGETADGTHVAVLIGADGNVLLNRTLPAHGALNCGGGGTGVASGVVNDGFAVARMVLPTTNGSGVNGSTEVSVGVLLDREWECFHGSRVLMLRGADVVLVAGSGLPPSDGAPQLAMRTRAWENVLGVVLAQSATYGGSQAYLGVKVFGCMRTRVACSVAAERHRSQSPSIETPCGSPSKRRQ